jgi:hypothetical protein
MTTPPSEVALEASGQEVTTEEKIEKSKLVDRTVDAPFLVVVAFKKGPVSPVGRFASDYSHEKILKEGGFSLYLWKDTSLEELGFLICDKKSSQITIGSKLNFRAIHRRPLKTSLVKSSELGVVDFKRPGLLDAKLLFATRRNFSLGDIIEVHCSDEIFHEKLQGVLRSDKSDLRAGLGKVRARRFEPYKR